jgi:hypothetical protein
MALEDAAFDTGLPPQDWDFIAECNALARILQERGLKAGSAEANDRSGIRSVDPARIAGVR